MASLVLGIVGTAIGGPIGGAIGSAIGGFIDRAIFSQDQKTEIKNEGPKLKSVSIMESTEGVAIPRIYGRTRVSGQLIWATKFLETIKTTTTTTGGGGGKGGGGGQPQTTTTTTEYLYSCSLAVAICEGPLHRMDRIWADGNLMDLSAMQDGVPIFYRLYDGSEGQDVSSFMDSKEGPGNNPAYRGTAYIIFQDLPLKDYGNRIPQFTFEVTRALGRERPNTMENLVKAVTLIPASGEFAYSTQKITRTEGSQSYYNPFLAGVDKTDTEAGTDKEDNKGNTLQNPDFVESMNQMQAVLPAVQTVALVVGWFGNDLRAGEGYVKPGIEDPLRVTKPLVWGVGSYTRATAHQVSMTNGKFNYGGTPSDNCVLEAIANLKARGFRVIFYPFIFMDIPAGNTLPNPYSDNAAGVGQPLHPWRGRITCSPAIGYAGTVDKTGAAATQINEFFDDWYIPFITHYANLCAGAPGGVDGFLIGSEYIGLTKVRSSAGNGTFPAVQKLKALAATVKGIVGGGCKVTYAADWSEYHSYRPTDGSNDVIYNMDPLWSDSNIDVIGIDNYLPISDWRDGTNHTDYVTGRTTYDIPYLQANINGGENFDWFYANQSDRNGQVRTPITDGAYSKPWTYRQKDFWSWWTSNHVSRVGGVETGGSTSWTPQSKQFWMTELGCPAIDKGANQPNVFFDPKSSESFFPYHSHGWRDDLIQRAFLEAHMLFWNQTGTSKNPTSSVYGGPMVDPNSILVWTWDARPFPFFPKIGAKWGDVANWDRGHWLNGRAGLAECRLIIDDLMQRQGFTAYDSSAVRGIVTGYVIDQPMSIRAAIEPMGNIWFFDGIESQGQIVFRPRDRLPAGTIYDYDMVVGQDGEQGEGPPYTLTRMQESELPRAVRLSYLDAAAEYRQATAPSRRLSTTSRNELQNQAPFVLEQAQAIGIAETMLIDAWVARETAQFILPPTALAYEPGDILEATLAGRPWLLRLGTISDAHIREAEAARTDRSVYQMRAGALRSYDGRLVFAAGTTQSSGFTATRVVGVTNGTNTITGTGLQFLQVGQPVYGPGVPPGTVITFVHPSGTYVTVSNPITVTDASATITFGNQPPPTVGGGIPPTQKTYGQSALVFADIPLLTGREDPVEPHVAAYADPWTAQALLRSSSGTGYVLNTDIIAPAAIGVLTEALTHDGVFSRWDYSRTAKVRLYGNDQLITRDELDVLAGANVILMETPTGEWEVAQFVNATLTGTRSYDLTQLLRGQAGTEQQVPATYQVGSRIVIYTSAMVQAALNANERNTNYYWRWGPARSDISDNSFQEVQRSFKGVGLRPYSPVHLKVTRNTGNNDLTFTWIRRTRFNGDPWGENEVPLNEDNERYELDVMDGGTVKRTIQVTTPSATYTAAQQTTDWGAPKTGSVAIQVYQMSVLYGRGNPGSETLAIY